MGYGGYGSLGGCCCEDAPMISICDFPCEIPRTLLWTFNSATWTSHPTTPSTPGCYFDCDAELNSLAVEMNWDDDFPACLSGPFTPAWANCGPNNVGDDNTNCLKRYLIDTLLDNIRPTGLQGMHFSEVFEATEGVTCDAFVADKIYFQFGLAWGCGARAGDQSIVVLGGMALRDNRDVIVQCQAPYCLVRPWGWTGTIGAFRAIIEKCASEEVDGFVLDYINNVLTPSSGCQGHSNHPCRNPNGSTVTLSIP